MNRTYQLLTLLLLCVFSGMSSSYARIKWVDVGVSGLTCSVCSKSVEMRINKLGFVKSVSTDLDKTESRVYLKEGATIDIRKIAKAVVEAGFSVRFLKIQMDFDDISVSKEGDFTFQGQDFEWINYQSGVARGEMMLKLVDKDFLPRQEVGLWKEKIKESSSQNAVHAVLEKS